MQDDTTLLAHIQSSHGRFEGVFSVFLFTFAKNSLLTEVVRSGRVFVFFFFLYSSTSQNRARNGDDELEFFRLPRRFCPKESI